jgi:hypothetical protein
VRGLSRTGFLEPARLAEAGSSMASNISSAKHSTGDLDRSVIHTSSTSEEVN